MTRRPGRRTRAVLAVLLGAVLAGVALHLCLATYVVTSGSMAPTLHVGDRLLVDKIRPHDVHRGEVVVFRDPGGWVAAERAADGRPTPAGPPQELVKRVVAVGGDRVVCCTQDDRILLNGHRLAEPYLPAHTGAGSLGFDRRVPRGMLFVLGDDREGSLDSRSLTTTPGLGFVPVGDVVGRVLLTLG